MDPRIELLAKNIVEYSTEVKKGDNVVINVTGSEPGNLVIALVREIYKREAFPFVNMHDARIERELMLGLKAEQIELKAQRELAVLEKTDVWIGIRAGDNQTEMADVPVEKEKLYMKNWRAVTTKRVNDTRWVVLRYPTYAAAQGASMSTEGFENFFFDVCNLDYRKMSQAMESLVRLMDKTDEVRITGDGTDITFSIKGMRAVKCDGKRNIPDGEVYTAPVKDSVNGVISYNTPAVYNGFVYENIVFEFKNGKIVKAVANDSERLNGILDTDEGARYTGEFAIGVNPLIIQPMKETLFDEKIMGSFHFTPGMCYEEASNGNSSSIHWDLVVIQRPEYGGGEIYFDGVLIRKDGRFVPEELNCLNPESLTQE